MSLAAADSTVLTEPARRLRFTWILDRRRDLALYIGSALAGWAYVALIAYAIDRLEDPFAGPLATLRLGGIEIPLTLELLVVASWAFLLDAPHVWGTLGRTLADPDEWRDRRRVLATSFLWFGLGPAAILAPYVVGALAAPGGHPLPAGSLAAGAFAFFVFFRLWAYYHVVRQHWGFVSLYRRKAGEEGSYRLDRAFFNLALYLPLLAFMTSSYYGEVPGMPDLGLHRPIAGGVSLATILHPLAWALYAGGVAIYVAWQVRLVRCGSPLNGSKLLYLALLLPLHVVVFSHPVLAAFVVPVVTVGHNIQYHAIVYSYARKKYGGSEDPRYRWPRLLFKNLGMYALVGLAFTFALYRGPWVEAVKEVTGLKLDEVLLNSLGMMAGIRDPAALGLGEQVFAAILVGFALQHYYLDAKIWRVSRDRAVQRHLGV
jgi:hypothetical protein